MPVVHIFFHTAVLVAYVTRTSSWLLHEDAYNRQTGLLAPWAGVDAVTLDAVTICLRSPVLHRRTHGRESPDWPRCQV